MNEYEHISHLIPDYINGTLDESDRILVEHAIASSADLKQIHDEFRLVFETVNRESIKHMMQIDSETVHVKLPVRIQNRMKYPKLMIGITTSFAACFLLWIGISHQHANNSQSIQSDSTPAILITDNVDDDTLWELHYEDVDEAILDDVLNLYVSDIETGKEINRLLENEITQYLLKENQDDEEL